MTELVGFDGESEAVEGFSLGSFGVHEKNKTVGAVSGGRTDCIAVDEGGGGAVTTDLGGLSVSGFELDSDNLGSCNCGSVGYGEGSV